MFLSAQAAAAAAARPRESRGHPIPFTLSSENLPDSTS